MTPLYCSISSGTVTITSAVDITSSGSLVVQLEGTNPSSSTISLGFTLYSRYANSSNFATSISSTFTHSIDVESGKTIMNRDQVDFMRFAPLRNLAGNINVKVRLKPLVSVGWNQGSTLVGKIAVTMSGLPSSTYYCLLKEFTN
jgi:hypothetical protein